MPPHNAQPQFRIGTSGYSFADWVGPFYRPGTKSAEMLDCYSEVFPVSEVNFTYYRMPSARTLASLARRTPPGYAFWVKAHQSMTHQRDRSSVPAYLDGLAPLQEAGKLTGVLLQFPQSFHRTVAHRQYLADLAGDLEGTALAVEFRHRSWQHESTYEGLAARGITLVVPDVPAIEDLFACPPRRTTEQAYLRLHSRNADLWYAGAVERYDYRYSDEELRELLDAWQDTLAGANKAFVLFNNCHRGQAAENAQAFQRLVEQIG